MHLNKLICCRETARRFTYCQEKFYACKNPQKVGQVSYLQTVAYSQDSKVGANLVERQKQN